ncbi:MAG TPA: hypothetical protein VN737_04300 [Bryobacteraceae bacterium]|nr:hypothetical protein [Bryobacteraceae bacterium]
MTPNTVFYRRPVHQRPAKLDPATNDTCFGLLLGCAIGAVLYVVVIAVIAIVHGWKGF